MSQKTAIGIAAILLLGLVAFWCRRPSLHVAAFYGSTVHAKVYLMLGADVNRKAALWGYSTPLDVARSPDMITLLKRHGGEYSVDRERAPDGSAAQQTKSP